MQQRTPPQGRLFPDPPEQQQPVSRFPNTNVQPYEPQVRMQQSGRLPVYNASQYTTGSLQALHGTQPVQSMQPLAAMPTASAYQAQQAAQQNPSQGTPVIVQTVQGVPVLVSIDELKRAVGEQEASPEKEPKDKRKSRKERQPRRSLKLSAMWFVFGLIGLATVLVQTARYVVIPLLVHFF